jgi:parallel beta-helix repeat protein
VTLSPAEICGVNEEAAIERERGGRAGAVAASLLQDGPAMRSRSALALVLIGCSGSAESAPDELAPGPGPTPSPSPAAPSPDCPAGKTCIPIAASDPEGRLAEAFATATPNTVLLLGEGTFTPKNTLALAGSGVTVRGAGRDRTILDFRYQRAGSEGVLAENPSDLVLEGFSVVDTRGNGVKVLGGDGVTLRDLGVGWTSEDASSHGAYGLYPVQSRRVLVEGCVVSGASDAGIYLGQSEAAIVRRNLATGNVGGIEIENSSEVDVYENEAVANTGGILVVDLPWPPRTGGRALRVHHNRIADNDAENFSPEGSFVASLPRGLGLLVLANQDVEIVGNTIRDNPSANAAIVSFFVTGNALDEARYEPYPSRVHLHGNTFGGGGDAPDTSKWLGRILAAGMPAYPEGRVPSIVYDGIVDPAKGGGPNPHEVCIREGGGTTFGNLRLGARGVDLGRIAAAATFDLAPHDCALPPVVPETFEP